LLYYKKLEPARGEIAGPQSYKSLFLDIGEYEKSGCVSSTSYTKGLQGPFSSTNISVYILNYLVVYTSRQIVEAFLSRYIAANNKNCVFGGRKFFLIMTCSGSGYTGLG
jgi:hypothetical protein